MKAACLAAALAWPVLAAAASHEITIDGLKYQLASVTVHRGDRVTWHNRDVVPHTVTAPGRFDSKDIGVGKSWSWTPKAAGTYDYICTYHPGMKGTVIVQ